MMAIWCVKSFVIRHRHLRIGYPLEQSAVSDVEPIDYAPDRPIPFAPAADIGVAVVELQSAELAPMALGSLFGYYP